MTTKIVEVKDMKNNPEKIRNSDKFPENKTIISHLRLKTFILRRNRVKTAHIGRFEKNGDESEKKSRLITLELSLTK